MRVLARVLVGAVVCGIANVRDFAGFGGANSCARVEKREANGIARFSTRETGQ